MSSSLPHLTLLLAESLPRTRTRMTTSSASCPSSTRRRQTVRSPSSPSAHLLPVLRHPDPTKDMRRHQLEGLNAMLKILSEAFNIILADDMGLGKTLQTISFLRVLHVRAPPCALPPSFSPPLRPSDPLAGRAGAGGPLPRRDPEEHPRALGEGVQGVGAHVPRRRPPRQPCSACAPSHLLPPPPSYCPS